MHENQSSANNMHDRQKSNYAVASVAWPAVRKYKHLNSTVDSTEYDKMDHIGREKLYQIPFRHIAIVKLY